jgi:hypothetical protein
MRAQNTFGPFIGPPPPIYTCHHLLVFVIFIIAKMTLPEEGGLSRRFFG